MIRPYLITGAPDMFHEVHDSNSTSTCFSAHFCYSSST